MINLKVNGKMMARRGTSNKPAILGDLCKEQIKYVRNFVLGDINTLKACPAMPYFDPARPYVNYWFASSEGASVDSFNDMLKESNQERLRSERGVCIMYTHFAKGFVTNGKINGRFKIVMEQMSKSNGWFVPVRTLLDYILKVKGKHIITPQERNSLERRWLWHKIAHVRGRS